MALASGLGGERTGRRWVPFSYLCKIIWASCLLGLISKWALRISELMGFMSWEACSSSLFDLRIAFPHELTKAKTEESVPSLCLSLGKLGGRRGRGGACRHPTVDYHATTRHRDRCS